MCQLYCIPYSIFQMQKNIFWFLISFYFTKINKLSLFLFILFTSQNTDQQSKFQSLLFFDLLFIQMNVSYLISSKKHSLLIKYIYSLNNVNEAFSERNKMRIRHCRNMKRMKDFCNFFFFVKKHW